MQDDAGEQAQQYLMIGLGGEIFALDASSIREILDPIPVTEVPGARSFMGGLINVRGKVVPVADLRLRFGMAPKEYTQDTRFVVVELELNGDAAVVAIVADKVHEVTEIAAASLGEAPRIGMQWQPEFIRRTGQWRDDFIIVPDMERIFH